MSDVKESRNSGKSISEFSTEELKDELDRRKDEELSEEVNLNEEI